jgi:beta-fructofuranosidase
VSEGAQRNAERAAADPARPGYHFLPPSGWMNDPNGTLYHEGFYHLFYQHNPYHERWDAIHWGHARSRDLVHWEHLPPALVPLAENGEAGCWSGACVVPEGEPPLILYSSQRLDPGTLSGGAINRIEQRFAWGDAQLLDWHQGNEDALPEPRQAGGPPVTPDWRDPYIFTAGNRTGLVIAARSDDEAWDALVLLYEAEDRSLRSWRYRGVLYRRPLSEIRFFECPNLFRLGQSWILLASPYAPVHYYIGTLDFDTPAFEPAASGILDEGRDFYATNTFVTPDRRRIVVGWISGFPEGRGWNGCLSLPRELSLDDSGMLRQAPARELRELREEHTQFRDLRVSGKPWQSPSFDRSMIELSMRIRLPEGLRLHVVAEGETSGRRVELLSINRGEVSSGDIRAERSATDPDEEGASLHLFWDRSVLEIFIDDGRKAITRVIECVEEPQRLELHADGAAVTISEFDVWTLREAEHSSWPRGEEGERPSAR